VCGLDLGRCTLATIAGTDNGADAELVPNPKPRKRLLGRIKRMQRRVALQKRRAKKAGQQKSSRRQHIRQLRLTRLHARVANIRKDAAHQLTTGLTRRFETIAIEALNVSSMAKNHSLAGAVRDCGFHEIRRQFEYKQAMRGVIANRFFPSTQTCSCCGSLTGPKGREELHVEKWVCSECDVEHARDGNAAVVVRKLGMAGAEVTRGDMMPLPLAARPAASVVAGRQTLKEPRTENVRTFAHIWESSMSPGVTGAGGLPPVRAPFAPITFEQAIGWRSNDPQRHRGAEVGREADLHIADFMGIIQIPCAVACRAAQPGPGRMLAVGAVAIGAAGGPLTPQTLAGALKSGRIDAGRARA
jgi:hypothetical protein